MTLSDISSFVNLRTGTTTTTYAAADRVISLNRWLHKITTMILDSMDGWDFDDTNATDEPIATANLVASQQAYAFPTNTFKIKRVEVQLDGSNWYKAEPLDINQIGTATDSTSIGNNFSTSQPFYDVENNQIKLYPIPSANVTGGIKIWYSRAVTEFTSSDLTTGTATLPFDLPFHPMVALGICHDWFVAKKLWNEDAIVQQELADYEVRLRKFYGSKEADTPIQLNAAYIDYN